MPFEGGKLERRVKLFSAERASLLNFRVHCISFYNISRAFLERFSYFTYSISRKRAFDRNFTNEKRMPARKGNSRVSKVHAIKGETIVDFDRSFGLFYFFRRERNGGIIPS